MAAFVPPASRLDAGRAAVDAVAVAVAGREGGGGPLPPRLVDIERTRFSRYALYAPRVAGGVNLWHAFPVDPWQPDVDLVVAVPRPGSEALFRLIFAEPGVDVSVEQAASAGPLLAVRRAKRGVSLADILNHSPGARPPLELLAMIARAFDEPGVRVLRVTSPEQIIVSWDGDVVVDGLDPFAVPRPWGTTSNQARAELLATELATGFGRADMEACLLAAVARGSVDYAAARRIVDEIAEEAASSTPSKPGKALRELGVVSRAILSRYAAPAARQAQPPVEIDVVAARAMLAGMTRNMFPERYERDRAFLEELALLPRSTLATWEYRRPQRRDVGQSFDAELRAASRATTCSMINAAKVERAQVDKEMARLVEQTRALVKAPITQPVRRPRGPSLLARFTTWLGDLWVSIRHRVANARVPRQLQASARPAPRPKRPKLRRKKRSGRGRPRRGHP